MRPLTSCMQVLAELAAPAAELPVDSAELVEPVADLAEIAAELEEDSADLASPAAELAVDPAELAAALAELAWDAEVAPDETVIGSAAEVGPSHNHPLI